MHQQVGIKLKKQQFKILLLTSCRLYPQEPAVEEFADTQAKSAAAWWVAKWVAK